MGFQAQLSRGSWLEFTIGCLSRLTVEVVGGGDCVGVRFCVLVCARQGMWGCDNGCGRMILVLVSHFGSLQKKTTIMLDRAKVFDLSMRW
jgi:hypothetical protein